MTNPIITRHASETVDELIGSAYPIVKKVAQNINHVKRISEHLTEVEAVYGAIQAIYSINTNITVIEALNGVIDGIVGIVENFDEILYIYNNIGDITNAANDALAAELKAKAWADNGYDVEVESNAYSAKHWAIFSTNKADAAYASQIAASGSASAASVSAANALVSENAAEAAKTAAETARNAAQLAETNAETAQTLAENARDAALIAETNAETAETNAETAETNAEAAQAAAELAEANAEAAATSASGSASSASTSATTATTQAGIATTQAGIATTEAATATAQAAIATTKAADAETARAAAVVAKNAAETAENNAETAQAAAETARNQAQTAETAAELAETNAEAAQVAAEAARDAAITAKNAAELAETNAETAETNAETAEAAAEAAQAGAEAAQTAAAASAVAADASADAAALSETAAETAATNAAASETAAELAETNAEAAQAAAEAAQTAAEAAQTAAELAETNAETAATNAINALDDFTDKYLGAKAADPSLDNDGDALEDGALYWNTTLKAARFYDLGTTTWSTVGGGGGGGTADTTVYDNATSGLTAVNVQDAIDEIDSVIDGIKTKTDWLTVTQAVNLDTIESDVAASKTKTDFITITQAVDLDAIEARVNALDAAVVLKGSWDASAGTFPGGGTAQAGDSYIVSVAGTVDGTAFALNDRIIAIADNASTTTFAANWFKADYTDQVLSVAGKTGAVTLQVADITDMSANGRSLVSAANYADMKTLLALNNVTNDAQVTVAGANQSITARKVFVGGATGNSAMNVSTSALGELEVRGNGTGAAFLTFHRPSAHAIYLGIDTDNKFKRGGWSLGANAYEILDESNMHDQIGGRIRDYNAQTVTSYTFVLTDNGKLVSGNNASAQTFTVPPNSTTAFPVGKTVINLAQLGAGQITIAAGAGVTIRSNGSKLKLNGQYATGALVKIATDEWILFGNTAA